MDEIMTLEELKQIKKDISNGIVISKVKWLRVLDEAIKGENRMMAAFEADGFTNVEKDRYDFACDVAQENGREEPNRNDEVEGVKRLIDEHLEKLNASIHN